MNTPSLRFGAAQIDVYDGFRKHPAYKTKIKTFSSDDATVLAEEVKARHNGGRASWHVLTNPAIIEALREAPDTVHLEIASTTPLDNGDWAVELSSDNHPDEKKFWSFAGPNHQDYSTIVKELIQAVHAFSK